MAGPLAAGRSAQVISDIAPFQTQDGTPITSRGAALRLRALNGVRQVGTDLTGSERPAFWDRAIGKRQGEEAMTGDCNFRVARNVLAPAGLIPQKERAAHG